MNSSFLQKYSHLRRLFARTTTAQQTNVRLKTGQLTNPTVKWQLHKRPHLPLIVKDMCNFR
jgi:hypothetical protein